MGPNDKPLVGKCTDVSNVLVYSLLMVSARPIGGHISDQSFLLVHDRSCICSLGAAVHEFELPSAEIGASDKDGFVNSLPSQIVVTCSTLERRLSSMSLWTIFSACKGVIISMVDENFIFLELLKENT